MKLKDLCLLPWSLGSALLMDFAPQDQSLTRKLKGYLRSRDLERLLQTCDTVDVASPDLPIVRQLSALFKKNAQFSDPDRCNSQAMKNFFKAEEICRITNKRIDHYVQHQDRLDPELLAYVDSMRKSISHLLGPVGKCLDEIPKNIRITGGATEDRSRVRSLPFLKISGKLRCPRDAFPLVEALMNHWEIPNHEYSLIACDQNRVEFVPKNWKTHRTIACEPTALLPIQLAFDRIFKVKLRRWGVDLSDQSWNQELATLGSMSGEYATVDLAMASDTLAVNAVCLLFSDEWWNILRRLRCPGFYIRGSGSGFYSKFASMGNGITFTLETIIFTAAVRAVSLGRYAVYGDDIVCQSQDVQKLIRLLRFLGFRPNVAKTFVTGPFRESCGVDSLSGRDITPFYLRRQPVTGPELCHVVNGLAKIGYPGSELWRIARTLQREFKLPLVPYSEDTMSGVHLDHHTARRLGKIRCVDWVERYRGFTPILKTRTNRGRRALLLYFISGGEPMTVRSFSEWHDANSRSREGYTSWVVDATSYTYGWRVLPYGPQPYYCLLFGEMLLAEV